MKNKIHKLTPSKDAPLNDVLLGMSYDVESEHDIPSLMTRISNGISQCLKRSTKLRIETWVIREK